MSYTVDIVDFTNKICKVVKTSDDRFKVDDILTIVSHTPLVDYKDLGTRFTFKTVDGVEHIMVIDGFTHDCIEEVRLRWPNPTNDPTVGLGIPSVCVSAFKETASVNDNVEAPSVSSDTDI